MRPAQVLADIQDRGIFLTVDESNNLRPSYEDGTYMNVSDDEERLIADNRHALIQLVSWREDAAYRIARKMLDVVWRDFPYDAQLAFGAEGVLDRVSEVDKAVDQWWTAFNEAYFDQDMNRVRRAARYYVICGLSSRKRVCGEDVAA